MVGGCRPDAENVIGREDSSFSLYQLAEIVCVSGHGKTRQRPCQIPLVSVAHLAHTISFIYTNHLHVERHCDSSILWFLSRQPRHPIITSQDHDGPDRSGEGYEFLVLRIGHA